MIKTFNDLLEEETEYLEKHVYNGFLELHEADGWINVQQFAKLEAYHREHNQLWLGLINKYEDTKDHPWMWQYDPDEDEPVLYIFGAGFFMDHYDQGLVDLLQKRDETPYTGTAQDYELVDEIMDYIYNHNGHVLVWT